MVFEGLLQRGEFLAAALALMVAALALASAAGAHEGFTSAEGHFEEDYVVHAPGVEREMGRESRQATHADATDAAADVEGGPAQVGEWGDVISWPLVGIHVALMPDGRVLAYDSVGDRSTDFYQEHVRTRALLWDPEAAPESSVSRVDAETGVNIFCSGLAHLADGTLFVAGGNKNAALDGSDFTAVFGGTGWKRTADMAYERWYPTVTPLQSGEMLITEGIATQNSIQPVPPEVRGLDGSIRPLNDAVYPVRLSLYPWMDAGPDGRVFNTGPAVTIRSIDPDGEGQWRDLGFRDEIDRDYGSHAMFDIGRVLVSGGGRPPTATSTTVDLRADVPDAEPTGSMAHPRRQHNLTMLADGSALATGGLSSDAGLVDLDHGVYAAELWDPDTGEWRELAAEARTRQYHSTAILLPDGRVLSSGGGICGVCEDAEPDYLEKNAQVFSPPYLFRADGSPAPRPQITAAPDELAYAQTFEVATPDPASIESAALVRLGAVTHSVNMEQRYVPLQFLETEDGIEATSPANENVAPPGYYMLFLVSADGTPSVARMVRIELPPTPSKPPPPSELPPPLDLIAPETRIDRGPKAQTRKRRVTFRFSADEAGSTFACAVDENAFRPCASPMNVRVKKGRHSFSVRASDTAGNTDPRPARRRFEVTPRRGGGG